MISFQREMPSLQRSLERGVPWLNTVVCSWQAICHSLCHALRRKVEPGLTATVCSSHAASNVGIFKVAGYDLKLIE